MARKYSNTAAATTLENVGGITPTSTQIVLANTSGYPNTFPFTLRLDPNTAKEELVTVNSGGGTSASPYLVSRGVDGTSAKSHSQYAVVTHGFSARDFREAQDHIDNIEVHSRPITFTNQVTDAPLNVTGQFVGFTNTAWPSVNFLSPVSGRIRVTVSGAIYNANTTTSTVWLCYRITGAISYENPDFTGLSVTGGRLYGSRSAIISGLSANVASSIIPTWNISSGSSATAYVTKGQLTVELLAF